MENSDSESVNSNSTYQENSNSEYESESNSGSGSDSNSESNSKIDDSGENDMFILETIYLKLCMNLYSEKEEDLELLNKFNISCIFHTNIPDFIENNELGFTSYKSDNYTQFIKNKINDYVNEKTKFVLKSSILVLIKILTIFENDYDRITFMILSNKVLNTIKYLNPNSLLITKEVNTSKNPPILTYDYVLQSFLFQMYKEIKNLEAVYDFCEKLFYINKSNYHILASEFDYIDRHYNLNEQKYNNLKFNLFLGSLSQLSVVNENKRFNHLDFIDPNNPPNSNSIRFPIYVSWCFYLKALNKIVDTSKINFTNLELRIDKFFFVILMLNNDLFHKIFKYLMDPDIDIDFISDSKYNINEIFDSNNNFITNEADYSITNDIKTTPTDRTSNYSLNNNIQNPNLVTVFGGGNSKIKIPVEIFNKLDYYYHYINK